MYASFTDLKVRDPGRAKDKDCEKLRCPCAWVLIDILIGQTLLLPVIVDHRARSQGKCLLTLSFECICSFSPSAADFDYHDFQCPRRIS